MSIQSKRGTFTVIMGGEGSGKSHMIRLLNQALVDGGITDVLTTREPGGSPFAEEIRATMFHPKLGKLSTPETQFCLALAARHDHATNKIKPALGDGIHVVCDRFDCCTYAYQVGVQPGLESLFWDMREVIFGNCRPDYYIFLDVDVKTGLGRAKSRKGQAEQGNFFDDATVEFHENIRRGYNTFLRKVPMHPENIFVLDANKPLVEVEAEFMGIMEKILQKKFGRATLRKDEAQ